MSIRKVAAGAILAAYGAVTVGAIGHQARGPFADPSLPRDLAAGLPFAAAAAAVAWALHQLGEPAPA